MNHKSAQLPINSKSMAIYYITFYQGQAPNSPKHQQTVARHGIFSLWPWGTHIPKEEKMGWPNTKECIAIFSTPVLCICMVAPLRYFLSGCLWTDTDIKVIGQKSMSGSCIWREGQRSYGSRSNDGSKYKKIGLQRCQVASLKYICGIRHNVLPQFRGTKLQSAPRSDIFFHTTAVAFWTVSETTILDLHIAFTYWTLQDFERGSNGVGLTVFTSFKV